MSHPVLKDIQDLLRQEGSAEARASFQKFVPTSQKVYGIRLPQINELAKACKGEGYSLVQALWKSGAFEERLLAAKILGKIAKQDPSYTLRLVHEFSDDIVDWAVCDTLGTQSVKPLLRQHQPAIFQLSHTLICDQNPWKKRLGIVLLEGYTKEEAWHAKIKEVLHVVSGEKDYYVKKAVAWITRNLNKKSA